LADIKEAQDIWEETFMGDEKPRVLFVYKEDADLPINLIYDERQATVDTNKTLKSEVNQTISSADQIKTRFLALKDQYAVGEEKYNDLKARFETELKSYNSEISYWNGRGGAPTGEYEKLNQKKATLEQTRNELQKAAVSLNNLGTQINSMLDDYNDLIHAANSNVDKINQSADKEFEEGEYISDATGERINIYEFENKNDLIRVLAHELGHALGIGHNDDPKSIMYYLNEASGLFLSAADVAALKTACKIK
jgi:chromosome segregation ATPase